MTGVQPPSRTGVRARRDQRVRRKRSELERVHPHLARPENKSTVRRWAELVVLGNALYQKLQAMGVVDEHGAPRPLLESFRRCALAQVQIERELLLTEKSRAEMAGSNSKPVLDGVFSRIRKIHTERHGETVAEEQSQEAIDAPQE